MKTVTTLLINSAVLLTIVGTAAAATNKTAQQHRRVPVTVEETVVISDASPGASRDAKAMDVTERRLAKDNQELRATRLRIKNDERTLPVADRNVALTRAVMDRDVARGKPDAAGLAAERHHTALMTRDQVQRDLRETQARYQSIERDRIRTIRALGLEEHRSEQQILGDLEAADRAF